MKRISSTLLIGLAQLLAEKGIRANAVAPGPIWTPLIPSTMPPDSVVKFGSNVPMKRPGQPAELATTYVMLAEPLSSYVSGATISVTGGRPLTLALWTPVRVPRQARRPYQGGLMPPRTATWRLVDRADRRAGLVENYRSIRLATEKMSALSPRF
jgi:hypothetical protein